MTRRSRRSFVAAWLIAALALASGAGCDAEPPELEPPRLVLAEKMLGALHLTWVNPAPLCDAVEIERRTTTPDGAVTSGFALVYSVPGVADNKHDGAATEDVTYGYRLRCQKAGRFSSYSNELSANPRR